MAAIDKIYIDSFEKYKLFKDWCMSQPKIKDKYGKETSLIDYVVKYTEEWKDGVVLPVCNNPYYIDAYLIRNCPFDFIQKELMLSYGKWSQDDIKEAYDIVMKRGGGKCESGLCHWLSKEDFYIENGEIHLYQGETDYDLIKAGKLYATPQTNKKYKVGKSFQIIKCPKQQYNRPYNRKKWLVDVEVPEELGYVWYHSNTNTWDFMEEFVIDEWSSSMCIEFKTIKAIKRAILKWKLPVGAIVTCTGRYDSDTYIFRII